MILGGNIRVNVYRMTPQTDDYVGGAMISGSVVHTAVPMRMQGDPDEQVLLQQGYETLRTYTFTVSIGGLDIRERDELQVVFPPSYPYYNAKFRVMNVRYSDLNDPRRYMILAVQRSVRSHTEQ